MDVHLHRIQSNSDLLVDGYFGQCLVVFLLRSDQIVSQAPTGSLQAVIPVRGFAVTFERNHGKISFPFAPPRLRYG